LPEKMQEGWAMRRALWVVVLGLACPAGLGGCAFFLPGSGDGDPSKYQGGVGLPKPQILPQQTLADRPGPSPSAPPKEPFDPGKL
jgi:hypothetical protein